jgi:ATP-dependent Clp protease adapter protein ClpS
MLATLSLMLINVESFSITIPIRPIQQYHFDASNVDRTNDNTISKSVSLLHSKQQYQPFRMNHKYNTRLYMSSTEKVTTKTTKKGTQVMDRTETKVEEKKNKEEMWRVVLHNDEVHTFNYVVRSLTKVIGILDRKAAFEICVQTHGIGKATITKTWKKQAEQFCLGLQRQGLTVSISPDEDFEGGHAGGGL